MSARRCQVAVVGAGFAGSLVAMICARLGLSTLLLERGRHPRFVIGESSTPLANLLLEEIAVEYDLPAVRPLCKWGSWQACVPQLGCGIKRGFTFYQHALDRPFAPDPERRRQLLVGASPCEAVADTHWYRPDFDQFLVEQAQRMGVEHLDRIDLEFDLTLTSATSLKGSRLGSIYEVQADFVIDATGPRGFLHRSLGLPDKPFEGFPATQALFSHFSGVASLPDCFLAGPQAPPFPPEQAAVHHVFPGGWIWVLKFNNGLTSAGLAACDPLAHALDLRAGQPSWGRLLARLPSLQPMFEHARATVPFVHQPRIAFQTSRVTGPGWALLPSAAGVVDPLLSTGFPLTLLGVKRLGAILKDHWDRPSLPAQLEEYGRLTLLELETTARLVGALYATMERFDLFKALSLLYFAAASHSETARRLGQPQLADSFLLCRDPKFAPQLNVLCAQARQVSSPTDSEALRQAIVQTIAPFDVAGLTDPSRDPWYPCLIPDLFRYGHKLGASRTELEAMVARRGLGGDGPWLETPAPNRNGSGTEEGQRTRELASE